MTVKYQSRLFSSGGYNWRLIIYPKGNAEDNGSGFISMYVEIDSESLMPPTEVCAELRFFVYNKRENKYLTIQDVEVKRFNALKTVWGLQQVLPCVTFNNPENGYIFQGGQCEFGVDVIVAPSLTNWEVFSFTEKFPDPKFCWAIKNFSELKENVIKTSKSFSMGGKKWFLKLYPKGHSRMIRINQKLMRRFSCKQISEFLTHLEPITLNTHTHWKYGTQNKTQLGVGLRFYLYLNFDMFTWTRKAS
ncbi:unnamed protein product [Eruca vesicaria subsp. sativa]|uniref:MATH domain-containing protein n=1 Tax=Eruca vesicaria subsp. sativa TaxID=29727 RepID=A0ABC8L4B5_ERUVS|nr:unnamed protein product [Eruca vesicaria subsp. sativa]